MKTKEDIEIITKVLEFRLNNEFMPHTGQIALIGAIQMLHYILEIPVYEEHVLDKGECSKLYKQMDDNIERYKRVRNKAV